METNFWVTLGRWLSHLIDMVVYPIFKLLYDLFWDLSQTSILSNDIIESFASRIYILIGIIMLFKLAFSLVNMFINPDSFTDDSKGFGKLVQRSIIALIMIVLIPTIFNSAYRIQTIILENNILGNLILGRQEAEKVTDENAANQITVRILGSFQTGENLTADSPLEDYLFVDIAKSSGGKYIYDYQMFIAPIAGVFCVIMIFNYVIDIAVRSVKMAFLQLIAPIPVLMYVDPKGAEGSFSKYITTCLKTYAGLLIRVASLYFVVYLIFALTKDGLITLYDLNGNPKEGGNWLLTPMVIIGLLFVAKEIPKMIEDIFGIKFDGDFSFTPWKRLSKVPVAAPLAAGGVTLARSLANGDGFRKSWSQAIKNGSDVKFTPDTVREKSEERRAARVEARHNKKMLDTGNDLNNQYDAWKKSGYAESTRPKIDSKYADLLHQEDLAKAEYFGSGGIADQVSMAQAAVQSAKTDEERRSAQEALNKANKLASDSEKRRKAISTAKDARMKELNASEQEKIRSMDYAKERERINSAVDTAPRSSSANTSSTSSGSSFNSGPSSSASRTTGPRPQTTGQPSSVNDIVNEARSTTDYSEFDS